MRLDRQSGVVDLALTPDPRLRVKALLQMDFNKRLV
jgi:hypothetical protein